MKKITPKKIIKTKIKKLLEKRLVEVFVQSVVIIGSESTIMNYEVLVICQILPVFPLKYLYIVILTTINYEVENNIIAPSLSINKPHHFAYDFLEFLLYSPS